MQVTIPEHTARALNREFEDKLVSAVLKRFSSKLFLLLPLRSAIAVYHSLHYIKAGLKALSVIMVDFSCALKLSMPIAIISAMREISVALMSRINKNYRFIVGFNFLLIVCGVTGAIQPTTSALLHNMSTLGISVKSMTDLLTEEKE